MPRWMDQHLWLFFLLPVVLGIALPGVGLAFSPFSIPLLFSIMVLSLLDLPFRKSVASALDRTGLLLLGIQVGVFGLLAWSIAQWFEPGLLIGFVIVGLAPSGYSVPAVVDLHHGDKAKALSLTLFSTILAPILIPPLTLLLAGQAVPIDVAKLLLNVTLLVGVPLVAAGVLKHTPLAPPLQRVRKPLNLVLLTLLVWGVTAQSAPFFYEHPLQAAAIVAALAAASLVVFALGWALGKNEKEKITYATFCYYKNNTFAVTLISTLFGPVPAVVGVLHIVVIRIVLAASTFRLHR
ncbi:hypothetical protein HYV43_04370 [Candidatus Micrarchaeota archaeon]|nr:hypothetical protein [Candidatus Micrarchaeota archaeon]